MTAQARANPKARPRAAVRLMKCRVWPDSPTAMMRADAAGTNASSRLRAVVAGEALQRIETTAQARNARDTMPSGVSNAWPISSAAIRPRRSTSATAAAIMATAAKNSGLERVPTIIAGAAQMSSVPATQRKRLAIAARSG